MQVEALIIINYNLSIKILSPGSGAPKCCVACVTIQSVDIQCILSHNIP